jgi:hypothetical protein
MFIWPGPDEQFPGDQSAPGLRIAGKRSQTASLLSKLKQTVIYTSSFKMRLAINRASLLLKYRRSRSGVRFATWFLVGRERGSLFTLVLLRN